MLSNDLDQVAHLDFEPRQLCECARDPDDCINVAAVLLRTCSGSVWWYCWECLAESRARPWLYCRHNRRHETHDEHFTLIGRK